MRFWEAERSKWGKFPISEAYLTKIEMNLRQLYASLVIKCIYLCIKQFGAYRTFCEFKLFVITIIITASHCCWFWVELSIDSATIFSHAIEVLFAPYELTQNAFCELWKVSVFRGWDGDIFKCPLILFTRHHDVWPTRMWSKTTKFNLRKIFFTFRRTKCIHEQN